MDCLGAKQLMFESVFMADRDMQRGNRLTESPNLKHKQASWIDWSADMERGSAKD